MRLEYGIKKCDVPKPKNQSGETARLLREFLASGKDAVRLVLEDGQSINSVQAILRTEIRRKGYSAATWRRSGEVYIVRTDC